MEAIDKAGDSLAEYYQKDPVKYKLLEPDRYYNKNTDATMTQANLKAKELTLEQRKAGYEAAVEVYNKINNIIITWQKIKKNWNCFIKVKTPY